MGNPDIHQDPIAVMNSPPMLGSPAPFAAEVFKDRVWYRWVGRRSLA